MPSVTPRPATTRFDADPEPSRLGRGFALVGAHGGGFAALVVVATIVYVAALAVLGADRAGLAWIEASLRATSFAVVVDPQTGSADAEALGLRLRAVPGVAAAVFRARDDALRDLVARGLPPPDGRNPLPDVWTVRFASNGAAGFPADAFATWRQQIVALPHVAAVQADDRGIERLDRDARRWSAWAPRVEAAVLSVLALVLAACAYLAGGGAAATTPPGRVTVSALALFAGTAAATSGVLGALAAGAATRWWNGAPPIAVEWTPAPLLGADATQAALVWLAVAIVMTAGVLAGGDRRP